MKLGFPVVFLVFCSIFTLGCKKYIDRESNAGVVTIVGAWELRHVQTGMIPTVSYPNGNGNILKFTATEYQLFSRGSLLKSGTYTIGKDSTALPGQCIDTRMERIIYDTNRDSSRRFQLTGSGQRLIFYSGCFPLDTGIYYEYERLGDRP